MRIAVLFLLLSLLVLSSQEIIKGSASSDVTIVPYTSRPPVIDGTYTDRYPSFPRFEWTGSSENNVTNKWGCIALLRMLHNETFLFVCLDFDSDRIKDGLNEIMLCLDSGTALALDDFIFDYGMSIDYGWPVGLECMMVVPPPFVTQDDHEIYELSIPLSLVLYNRRQGFYIAVVDQSSGTFVEIPEGAGGNYSETRDDVGYPVIEIAPPSSSSWLSIELEGALAEPTPPYTPVHTPSPAPTPTFTSTPTPTQKTQPTFPFPMEYYAAAAVAAIVSIGVIVVVLRNRKRSAPFHKSPA